MKRTIVQYWDQGAAPYDVCQLMRTWQLLNPDFEYKAFDRNSAAGFLRDFYGDRAVNVFHKAMIPAMRSDIFRLAYIVREGGLYVDVATECVKPICGLLSTCNGRDTLLVRKWHGGIWNGFIYSLPKNEFLQSVWERVVLNVEKERHHNIWKATGPGVFNAVANERLFTGVCIVEQKFTKTYFSLVNDLNHKKNAHWSRLQKCTRIYR